VHFYILNYALLSWTLFLSMSVFYWSSLVCHKHEVPWACPHITNLLSYWPHPKHIHLQTHMANIWNLTFIIPSFLPLRDLLTIHIQGQWDRLVHQVLWQSNGIHTMILSFFLTYEIHDICSFTTRCNYDVVSIVIVIRCNVQLGFILSHALVLITWHV
jgi:hypothetical protein